MKRSTKPHLARFLILAGAVVQTPLDAIPIPMGAMPGTTRLNTQPYLGLTSYLNVPVRPSPMAQFRFFDLGFSPQNQNYGMSMTPGDGGSSNYGQMPAPGGGGGANLLPPAETAVPEPALIESVGQ